jgi:TrmH family RNA methyltransferase
VETVTNRRSALVARFRSAAGANRRSRTHLLLDGRRLIADAMQAGAAVDTVLVAAAKRRADPALAVLVADCIDRGIQVVAGSERVMAAVSPLRSPSSAVALATHRPPALDDVLACAARGCLLAPLGVQDPGNIGAIVRAADAAGAGGVIVAEAAADPFGWKALRGAMGSTFRLPVADAGDGRDLPERARRAGCAVVATTPRGGRSMYDLDLTRRLLILIGGEGAGIGPSVVESTDEVVSIPMAGGVESLNAAVAAALVAYEARRQRTAA